MANRANWSPYNGDFRDYAAAVAHAGKIAGVDRGRIAVWGTYFAGGHALVTAARMPGVAAAVCSAR